MNHVTRAGRQTLHQFFGAEQRFGEEGAGKEKDEEKQHQRRSVAQQVDIQPCGQGGEATDAGGECADQEA